MACLESSCQIHAQCNCSQVIERYTNTQYIGITYDKTLNFFFIKTSSVVKIRYFYYFLIHILFPLFYYCSPLYFVTNDLNSNALYLILTFPLV